MRLRASPRVLEVADRLRRIVWRLYGPRTIGVRGLVVGADGRVMLVRHTYGPQLWHLPGGGVKRRESIEDALRRELSEEVGVLVRGAPRLLGTYSNMSQGKSDHISVFVVEEWERERSDSSEIDRCSFFSPDALPEGVSPGTARRIREWAGDETPRSYEW